MTTIATPSMERGAAERDQIVELARELGRRELGPRALELDGRCAGALEAAWEKLTEVGFDRALVGAEGGGVGLDRRSFLLCLEEVAAGDGGVAMLMLLSNAALAALPAELITGMGENERWAMVPAPAAELPTGARVSVREEVGGTVNGLIDPALGALGADGLVIVTRGPAAEAVPVRTDAAGVEIFDSSPQLGLRAAASARVSLADAAAACPPAAGDARIAAIRSIGLLRAGSASIARGVARRAARMASEYAQDRIQGGVPIVDHDAVRDMLTAMTVRLASTSRGDSEDGDADALIAKIAATDAAVETTTDAVQVFGGTGYMHETGVEKLMRDAKYLQMWPEPNWIAAAELGAAG